MSNSRFHHFRLVHRHAWLNLWDKHMTAGRINQVSTVNSRRRTATYSWLALRQRRSSNVLAPARNYPASSARNRECARYSRPFNGTAFPQRGTSSGPCRTVSSNIGSRKILRSQSQSHQTIVLWNCRTGRPDQIRQRSLNLPSRSSLTTGRSI